MLDYFANIDWSDPVEIIEACYASGWTDGLPVVPPEAKLVDRFIAVSGQPRETVIGSLPERRRTVTIEKVAANAVMAGCLPEYFPVLH